MTSFTSDFFISASQQTDSRFLLIPVTSRTQEQFQRLQGLETMTGKYALICNGGKLLINGVEDTSWTRQTLETAEKQMDSLIDTGKQMRKLPGEGTLHHPEPYMFYQKADNPQEAAAWLKQYIDPEKVAVYYDQRKVYAFTESVNKGRAVQRFKPRIRDFYTVAAGDGLMDVPMLEQADLALCGEQIWAEVQNKNKRMLRESPGTCISDQICEEIKGIITY